MMPHNFKLMEFGDGIKINCCTVCGVQWDKYKTGEICKTNGTQVHVTNADIATLNPTSGT